MLLEDSRRLGSDVGEVCILEGIEELGMDKEDDGKRDGREILRDLRKLLVDHLEKKSRRMEETRVRDSWVVEEILVVDNREVMMVVALGEVDKQEETVPGEELVLEWVVVAVDKLVEVLMEERVDKVLVLELREIDKLEEKASEARRYLILAVVLATLEWALDGTS